MKALFLSYDEYPHCGGKSTHMTSLIEGLKELNVDSKVISKSNLNSKKIFFKKLFLAPIKFLNKAQYLYLRRKLYFNELMAYAKKYISTNNDFDFVSCQDAFSCTIAGRLKIKKPITLTMHTYFGLEYTLDNKIMTNENKYYKKLVAIEEESLKYCKNVVAVDERIRQHVIDTINKNKETNSINTNVHSIMNFINTNTYNTQKKEHDGINLMCVRRLVEKNGVNFAAESMIGLPKDKNIHLNIYGDGPELQKISKTIETNNLFDTVKLCGAVDNSIMPDLYKTADIVLVPSITVNGLQEATSISALESMSCGIPTIASNIGGLAQMIEDGKTGLLVNEQQPKEITNAINKLINDKNLYSQISNNCRDYIIKNHSHINAAKEYLKIFTS